MKKVHQEKSILAQAVRLSCNRANSLAITNARISHPKMQRECGLGADYRFGGRNKRDNQIAAASPDHLCDM